MKRDCCMKKQLLLALALVGTLWPLSGCAALPPAAEPPEQTLDITAEAEFPFPGTVFRFNGTDYDLAARDSSVNAITDCTLAGDYAVLEGHISPNISYYGLFNLKTALRRTWSGYPSISPGCR